ncbi:MAG TPA: biotin/lipoyl-containing protein [Ktedonobacteraceae bacterium]|jgi:biotin carboxyl carrier protein|nr:biotin/lipoyl-containing protein [Ktedonobacteraceae bacterium]
MDGIRPERLEALNGEEYNSGAVVSVEQLQRLVRLLDNSDVTEIEVKRPAEGTRLVLRKAKVSSEEGSLHVLPAPVENAEEAPPADTKYTITAPLVGIFHSWAKPKGKPLVSPGDHVRVGQPVGTIQSLNVINEVESLVAGRVTEILVEDGQPVEYGQALMTVEKVEEA